MGFFFCLVSILTVNKRIYYYIQKWLLSKIFTLLNFIKPMGYFYIRCRISNQRVKGTFYHSQFIPRNTLLSSKGKKKKKKILSVIELLACLIFHLIIFGKGMNVAACLSPHLYPQHTIIPGSSIQHNFSDSKAFLSRLIKIV